jgi:hypothetical protein
MPLDHYVSQVHLKNFYSPALGGNQMYGFRKRDGQIFPCRSKDVCRVESGSTNEYLLHDRAIEEFLKTVEPNYNAALAEMRTGKPSRDSIHAIAGFAAYVTSCSPTAMRLGADPLRREVEATAKILDRQGAIPKAPAILGGKSITELLADASVEISIDEKYPQALGITGILHRVGIWGNSPWDILLNGEAQSPFFTNDFAGTIERSSDPRVLNRVFPLAPDLAVRIRPDIAAKKLSGDFSFPSFRARLVKPSFQETCGVNRGIVRCAEDLVFFGQLSEWVEGFLRKNRSFRLEPETAQIPVGGGFLNLSTIRIRPLEAKATTG